MPITASQLVRIFEQLEDETGLEFQVHSLHGEDVKESSHLELIESLAKKINQEFKPKKKTVTKAKSEFDFKPIVGLYPNKTNISWGIKRCKDEIKTQADYDQLMNAVNRFRQEQFGKDPQFIKTFASFMSVWREYIELGELRFEPKVLDPAEMDFDQ